MSEKSYHPRLKYAVLTQNPPFLCRLNFASNWLFECTLFPDHVRLFSQPLHRRLLPQAHVHEKHSALPLSGPYLPRARRLKSSAVQTAIPVSVTVRWSVVTGLHGNEPSIVLGLGFTLARRRGQAGTLLLLMLPLERPLVAWRGKVRKHLVARRANRFRRERRRDCNLSDGRCRFVLDATKDVVVIRDEERDERTRDVEGRRENNSNWTLLAANTKRSGQYNLPFRIVILLTSALFVMSMRKDERARSKSRLTGGNL